MKKFFFVLVLFLCFMFILSGCTPSYGVKYSPPSSEISSNEKISETDTTSMIVTGDFYNTTKHLNIYVIVDSKTGVNYIVTELYQNAVQIVPRLNADGSLYITK